MPFHKHILTEKQTDFRFDFVLEPEPDYTTFMHFLALPKELREEIYTTIFNDSEKVASHLLLRNAWLREHTRPRFLNRPIEPAICRVSKTIRDEALPLFYHLYELKVDVLTIVPKGRKPRLSFGSEHWQRIPAHKFCWLRHIRITFLDTALYYGRRISVEVTIRFFVRNRKHQYDLDIATDISTWLVRDQHVYRRYLAYKVVEHRDEMVAAIRAQSTRVLDWLITDEKYGKWTPADFKRLVEWDEDLFHRS